MSLKRKSQRYIYIDHFGKKRIVYIPFGWKYVNPQIFGQSWAVTDLQAQTRKILVEGLAKVSKYSEDTLKSMSLTALWKVFDYVKEGRYLNETK